MKTPETEPQSAPCYWKHLDPIPRFKCHVDGHTVCARCCVEHCLREEPEAFARCQAAGHPTWPKPSNAAPQKLVCIEGYWNDGALFDGSSVQPFLAGLSGIFEGLKVAHRRIDGLAALRLLTRKRLWSDVHAEDVPIFYLGFDGAEGLIDVGGNKAADADILSECFEDYGAFPHIIYFSSCGTLGGKDGSRLVDRLFKRAGSRAVIGYTHDADWVSSMLIDLHFMDHFYHSQDPWADLPAIRDAIYEDMPMARRLGWTMFLPDET